MWRIDRSAESRKASFGFTDSLLEATIEIEESLLIVPSRAEQFAELPVTGVAKPHFYGL